MVCRDKARGDAARVEIVESSGNAAVELSIADLASQEATRQLARDFTARHDRLDVVVNNAGVYLTERQVTVDGFEMMFAVNYLARFLLPHLLLAMIKRFRRHQRVDQHHRRTHQGQEHVSVVERISCV